MSHTDLSQTNIRISPDQNFSELTQQLQEAYDKQGKGGVLCQDDKGFFINKNTESLANSVRVASQFGILHDVLRNPAHSLSNSIDREFGNLMVGDQRMSEYVLGNLMQSEESFQLGQEALTDLRNRALIGVTLAYNTAVRNDDKKTMKLINQREGVEGGASHHVGESKKPQGQGGSNQRAEGYRLLRNAVAAELEKTPAFAETAAQLGDNDDEAIESSLAYADKIIADAGATHLGLTQTALDKVLAYLDKNIALERDSNAISLPSFTEVEALYGKVELYDSVSANIGRLRQLNTDLEDSVHNQEQNGTYDGPDAQQVLSFLKKSRQTLEQLEANAEKGTLYDPAVAKFFSNALNDVASVARALWKGNPDVNQYPENNNASRSTSSAGLAEKFSEFAVTTYDLANSLAPNAAVAQPSNAIAPIPMSDDPLRQDRALSAFHHDRPLAQRLNEHRTVYQEEPAEDSGSGAAMQSNIERYNSHLNLVAASFENYVGNPDANRLESLRSALRSAIDFSNTAAMQYKAVGGGKLSARGDNTSEDSMLLEAQSRALKELSFAADRTWQNLFRDETSNAAVSSMPLERSNAANTQDVNDLDLPPTYDQVMAMEEFQHGYLSDIRDASIQIISETSNYMEEFEQLRGAIAELPELFTVSSDQATEFALYESSLQSILNRLDAHRIEYGIGAPSSHNGANAAGWSDLKDLKDELDNAVERFQNATARSPDTAGDRSTTTGAKKGPAPNNSPHAGAKHNEHNANAADSADSTSTESDVAPSASQTALRELQDFFFNDPRVAYRGLNTAITGRINNIAADRGEITAHPGLMLVSSQQARETTRLVNTLRSLQERLDTHANTYGLNNGGSFAQDRTSEAWPGLLALSTELNNALERYQNEMTALRPYTMHDKYQMPDNRSR